MLIYALFLLAAYAEPMSYLRFSNSSNPLSETLEFTYDYSFIDSDSKSYTVEFWMRPAASQMTVMQDEDDWQVTYAQDTVVLARLDNSAEYCTFSAVRLQTWSHISFGKSTTTRQFTCYKDALAEGAVSTGAESPTARYPDYVYLGATYDGNILDLRFWLSVVRSQEAIAEDFTRYFLSPFPENLHLYWRLTDPTDPEEITESVAGYSVDVPSSWNTNDLWQLEDAPPILCATNQFFLESACGDCHPICSQCFGEDLNQCEQTTPNYLDMSRNPSSINWVPFNPNSRTVEIWFMVNAGSATPSPVFELVPILKVQEDNGTLVCIDTQGQERVQVAVGLKTWTHFTFSRTSAAASIMINGEVVASEPWEFEAITNVYLGTDRTSDNFFNGLVRDLRLWKTARESEEVLQLINTELDSPYSSDLDEYWKLNEGSGSTLSDAIGNVPQRVSSAVRDMWRPLNCTLEGCLVLCGPNEYLGANAACEACDPSCAGCSAGTNADCFACSEDSPYFLNNTCYSTCPEPYKNFLELTECVLECPERTSEVGQSCITCDESCKECSGPSDDECTDCFEGFNVYQGTCRQDCPVSQYPVGTVCLSCNDACLECDGPLSTDCIACNTTVLLGNTCVDNCPERMYDQDGECEDCDPSCLTCNGPEATDCEVCGPESPFLDESGFCIEECLVYSIPEESRCASSCPLSYFELGQECYQCDSTCAECNGPEADNCIQCVHVLYRGTCLDECPEETYLEETTCFDCDDACKACTGPQPTDCTVCNDAFPFLEEDTKVCVADCSQDYFVLNTTCVRECPESFYELGTVCAGCDSNCADCEESADYCVSCTGELALLDNSCVSSCPDRYFQEEGVCEPCDATCQECAGTLSTDCTVCSADFPFYQADTKTCVAECSLDAYIVETTCFAECPVGTYPSLVPARTCEQCEELCLACADQTQCTACGGDLNLYENTCIQECPSGFFGEENECTLCDEACLTCVTSGVAGCTQCRDDLLLYVSDSVAECVEECPVNSFAEGFVCALCSIPGCDECTSPTFCQKCGVGQFLSSTQAGVCVDTCEPGTIGDLSENACTSFSSVFPEGELEQYLVTKLELTYSRTLQAGAGTLRVFNSTGGVVKEVSAQSSELLTNKGTIAIIVPPSAWALQEDYTVDVPTGFVELDDGSFNVGFSWNFSVQAQTLRAVVATINNGLQGLEVRRSSNFLLDASKSYDPEGLLLSFAWSCEDYSASYLSYKGQNGESWADYVENIALYESQISACSVTANNTAEVELTLNFPIDTVHKYTVDTHATDSRTSSAYVLLRVVSASTPTLSIANVPTYKVSVEKPLQLTGSSEFAARGLTWSVRFDKEFTEPVFLTPLTETRFMTIQENSLSPGASYTISLTYSDIDSETSSTISIVTNEPPSNCVLSLLQGTGTALVTQFTGQLLACTDQDLPLSYSFTYAFDDYTVPDLSQLKSGTLAHEYPLTSTQTSNAFTRWLPGGRIIVIGYVYDSLGSRSFSSYEITVAPQNDLVTIKEAVELLPAVVDDEHSAVETLALVGMIGIELNKTWEETGPADEIKRELITRLNDCTAFAQKLESIPAALLYYHILSVLEPLTRQPVGEMTVTEILETAASIDPDWLNVTQILVFTDSDVQAESTQLVLNTKDLFNLANLLATSVVQITDVFRLINTEDLLVLTEEILSLNSQLTEEPKVLSLAKFILNIQQDFLASLSDRVYTLDSATSVTLPKFTAQDEVELRIVKVLNTPLGNDTLNLQEYIVMEIISSGELYPVESLDSPILFTYELSTEEYTEYKERVYKQTGVDSVWPECTFRDGLEWIGDGCSLYNIDEVYAVVQGETNGPLRISCACFHLSEFTVSFAAGFDNENSVIIIRDSDHKDFSLEDFEASIVIQLLIYLTLVCFFSLSCAFYWDLYNPGLSHPSIMAGKTFGYSDPNKIDEVIKQLAQDYVNYLSLAANPSDTRLIITRMIASGTFYRLLHSNERHEFIEDTDPPSDLALMLGRDDRDSFASEASFGDGIPLRIRSYLNEEAPAQEIVKNLTGRPTRNEIDATIEKLEEYVYKLEGETNAVMPVEQFVEDYDVRVHPFYTRKFKLQNADLSKVQLKSLGYELEDFYALRTDQAGNLGFDPLALTGNNYCKHLSSSQTCRRYQALLLLYQAQILVHLLDLRQKRAQSLVFVL